MGEGADVFFWKRTRFQSTPNTFGLTFPYPKPNDLRGKKEENFQKNPPLDEAVCHAVQTETWHGIPPQRPQTISTLRCNCQAEDAQVYAESLLLHDRKPPNLSSFLYLSVSATRGPMLCPDLSACHGGFCGMEQEKPLETCWGLSVLMDCGQEAMKKTSHEMRLFLSHFPCSSVNRVRTRQTCTPWTQEHLPPPEHMTVAWR